MRYMGSCAVLLKRNVAKISFNFRHEIIDCHVAIMVAIGGYVLTDIIFRRNMLRLFHQLSNYTKLLYLLEKMAALKSLQLALCPKCGNLHTHRARDLLK